MSPNASKIAFVSDRDGHDEIYVMSADGSGQTRLTNTIPGYWNREPAWSPDGSKIAFLRGYTTSSFGIYIMNADGSGLVSEYALGPAMQPTWSPDGSRIAFVRYLYVGTGGYYQVLVYNLLANTLAVLVNNVRWDAKPAWSPDGSRIAFVDQYGRINLVNATGGGQVLLTGGGEPAWSPDGSQLAFSRDVGGSNYEIFVISANGGASVPLTNNPAVDLHPSWAKPPALRMMP